MRDAAAHVSRRLRLGLSRGGLDADAIQPPSLRCHEVATVPAVVLAYEALVG